MREMKDSGVEWIGEIPEDWNVGKTWDKLQRQTGGAAYSLRL